jgi:hypothetical protein
VRATFQSPVPVFPIPRPGLESPGTGRLESLPYGGGHFTVSLPFSLPGKEKGRSGWSGLVKG